MSCIYQVTGILSWIVRSWTDVENNIVSVERVSEYADTPKEVSAPGPHTFSHGYGQTLLPPLLTFCYHLFLG